jgi:hypothetical protein
MSPVGIPVALELWVELANTKAQAQSGPLKAGGRAEADAPSYLFFLRSEVIGVRLW